MTLFRDCPHQDHHDIKETCEACRLQDQVDYLLNKVRAVTTELKMVNRYYQEAKLELSRMRRRVRQLEGYK